MSKTTMSKIEATAALVAAHAAAIRDAQAAGLSASEVIGALEALNERLSEDEG